MTREEETLLEHLEEFINHHTEIKDVYRFIKLYKQKNGGMTYDNIISR